MPTRNARAQRAPRAPPEWKPGDIGPVRLMSGEFNDAHKRIRMYRALSTYPFWQEQAAYFVTRPFAITLPAGKWRSAVEGGLEYTPVFEDFARWVNMREQAWYSGDDHIPYPRLKPEHDAFLLDWARAGLRQAVGVAKARRNHRTTECAIYRGGTRIRLKLII